MCKNLNFYFFIYSKFILIYLFLKYCTKAFFYSYINYILKYLGFTNKTIRKKLKIRF